MNVIDNHTHAFKKDELRKLIKSMDKNSIDKAIVLHIPDNNLNKQIENIRDFKKRLYLLGSINITNNNNFYNDFIELHNAIINKDIYGVKLYLGYEHFYANDKRCNIIYQMCEKYNIPVVFHTGDTWIEEKSTSLIKYANPIYIDEIAIKYPKLKLVISHMGNPIWIKETAELVYKNKNIYTDFSGMLINIQGTEKEQKRAKEYNNKTKEKIIDLINYVGDSKKIMFGSDYNYFTQDIYIDFLKEIENLEIFSKYELDNIKFRNAEKVYNINTTANKR